MNELVDKFASAEMIDIDLVKNPDVRKLKQTTLNNYNNNFKRILKLYPDHNGTINIKLLMEKMRHELAPNVQQVLLSALKYKYECKEINVDSFDDLNNNIKYLTDIVNMTASKCKLTASQRKQFTSWYNILNVYRKIKELAENSEDKRIWEDYTLLSCFILIPPRRNELAYMYIGNAKEYSLDGKNIMKIDAIDYKSIESKEIIKLEENKMYITDTEISNIMEEYEECISKNTKDDNEEKNLYINKDGKSYLIYKKYKTDGSYGDQIIEIPENLNNIIQKYIQINHLKMGDKLTCKNRDEISKRLKLIFFKTIKKKIGCSMLRHIFISHCDHKHLLQTVEQKQLLANLMSHGITTQGKYLKVGYQNFVDIELPLQDIGLLYRKPGRPKKQKK